MTLLRKLPLDENLSAEFLCADKEDDEGGLPPGKEDDAVCVQKGKDKRQGVVGGAISITEIYRVIDGFAPFSSAEEFDNVGLLVGSMSASVDGVLVALDASREVLDQLPEGGLLVTHHPIIFDPLKRLSPTHSAALAAAKHAAVISAHTNVDACRGGLSDTLAGAFGLTGVEHEGCLYYGDIALSFQQTVELADRLYGGVRYAQNSARNARAAVCSGAGGGFLERARELGADVLITGDVKHSAWLEAKNAGISLLDCGHFETELAFCGIMRDLLVSAFPALEVTIAKESRPYELSMF